MEDLLKAPRTFCIGIDLDAIVIDLLRPWLGWHNDQAEPHEHLTVEHMVKYKVEAFAKPGVDMFKFFEDHSNYANCPVLPGAAEALEELVKKFGHDVIISTATAGQTANLKWDLVRKAAPWFNENNVMVGSRKERMHFDIFIDDAPKNIVKQRNKWGKETKILTISYPYNQDCRTLVDLMAMDHNNTSQAWGQICDYIRNYSNSYNTMQQMQVQ